jgi:hypothetical protein
MSQTIFSVAGILTLGAPTHDGGMRLRIETQELKDEEKLALIKCNGKFGNFLFKENQFQQGDIPSEDIEDKNKTPAKRLRNVLFVMHIQQGGKKEEFEPFYRDRMEQLINQIKSRLDQ